MPQIRSYPQATFLEETDAFVIDREGTGTMFIDAEDLVSDIIVQDEGVQITPSVSLFNFVGDGVTATATGTEVTVTIPGGSGLASVPFQVGLSGDISPVSNALNIPFDTNTGSTEPQLFDPSSVFNFTFQPPVGYGPDPIPAFVAPETGVYFLYLQAYTQVNSAVGPAIYSASLTFADGVSGDFVSETVTHTSALNTSDTQAASRQAAIYTAGLFSMNAGDFCTAFFGNENSGAVGNSDITLQSFQTYMGGYRVA